MPARSHQTLHWKPQIMEHTTPTQTQTRKRKLLNIYFHVLVTFIGKQDQGSTATSTVHLPSKNCHRFSINDGGMSKEVNLDWVELTKIK